MKNTIRPVLVLAMMIQMLDLTLICCARPLSTKSLTRISAAQADLLKAVKQQMNFNQIKTLLPSSTHFSKPVWHDDILSDLGNIVSFQGKLNGRCSFLGATKSGYPEQRTFNNTDTINFLVLEPYVQSSSKRDGQLYIANLSKYLGKPASVEWDGHEWNAEWRLSGGKQVDYGVVGLGGLMLRFRNTVTGDT